ncbi:MAG: hypothetical protein EP347_06410 [Alphaproteobacteria bacterium]|nr:MAG: hypothetical protein EP347_06410 [Alphaproteobacteria bacterium]
MRELTKTPYEDWLAYFEANAKARAKETLAFDERPLSERERQLIGRSLAQFQLGERSEGHNLIGRITAYSHEVGEPALTRLAVLLIDEEYRHAAMLAQFMEHHSLPLLEHHWVDSCFRYIRRFGGLDLMLTTLLIALTIASQYYRSLGPASRSPMLKRMCVILREEEAAQIHLLNQLIEEVRGRRPSFGYWWRGQAAKVIFGGALLIVWFNHSRIYRRSGIGFAGFWRVNWRQWRQSGTPPTGSINPTLAHLLRFNDTDPLTGPENGQ